MGVATRFVEHLQAVEGLTATDLRPGEDRDEPDVVCAVDGRAHGIEVVDCYPSDDDARALWTGGEAALYEEIRGPIQVTGPAPDLFKHPSGDPLVAALEVTMRATIKSYGMRTWLILNAGGVLWPWIDERSGPRLVSLISKPPEFDYRDVYVCLTSQTGTYHFFRVS
jgi:hypothetical protein